MPVLTKRSMRAIYGARTNPKIAENLRIDPRLADHLSSKYDMSKIYEKIDRSPYGKVGEKTLKKHRERGKKAVTWKKYRSLHPIKNNKEQSLAWWINAYDALVQEYPGLLGGPGSGLASYPVSSRSAVPMSQPAILGPIYRRSGFRPLLSRRPKGLWNPRNDVVEPPPFGGGKSPRFPGAY